MNEESWEGLVDAAKEARKRAYAPYSRFLVGASVQSTDGRIFAGCNVENVSYGATICAERSAIAAMITAGARELERVVVFTDTPSLTTPCGVCRQVIGEFGPAARVLCVNPDTRREFTLPELLPAAFDRLPGSR